MASKKCFARKQPYDDLNVKNKRQKFQGIFVFIPSSRFFSLTCLVGFFWILRGSTVTEDAGIEPRTVAI